jgi:hypothetical protein
MNATIGPAPLVLGIGAAGFASGGRGELSAPTSELSKALKRAIGSERSKGRQVTVLSVDEFRTTMCCCACGEVTAPPRVRRRKFDPMTGMVARAVAYGVAQRATTPASYGIETSKERATYCGSPRRCTTGLQDRRTYAGCRVVVYYRTLATRQR